MFIVGHLRGASTRKIFPVRSETNKYSTVGKSTETAVARTFTAGGNSAGNHSGMTIIQLGNIDQHKRERDNPNTGRVYSTEGISPTLSTMQGGGLEPKIVSNMKIRKLTPKECWRLQGFPDELFERAAEVNSDSQLYKQAGNSVTVNVIHEIAKKF